MFGLQMGDNKPVKNYLFNSRIIYLSSNISLPYVPANLTDLANVLIDLNKFKTLIFEGAPRQSQQ